MGELMSKLEEAIRHSVANNLLTARIVLELFAKHKVALQS